MELDLSSITPLKSSFYEREQEVVEDSLDQVMELIRLANETKASLARKAVVELARLLDVQEKGWRH